MYKRERESERESEREIPQQHAKPVVYGLTIEYVGENWGKKKQKKLRLKNQTVVSVGQIKLESVL